MFGLSILWERVILGGIIVLLATGLVVDLEYRGYQRCENKVQTANVVEEKKEDTQHGKDVVETQKEGQEYANAKSEPIAPAPIIRLGVCPTLHYKAGPPTSSPGPGPDATAAVRTEDTPVSTVYRWDTEPVVRAGHDADKQIIGLQEYITKVCRPGVQ